MQMSTGSEFVIPAAPEISLSPVLDDGVAVPEGETK